jgi:hypothetical protein
LKRKLLTATGLRVSTSSIRRYLIERLGMSYVRLGTVSILNNTHELRILRQIAARRFIELLQDDVNIINVDPACN